jgi:hypothetical protein
MTTGAVAGSRFRRRGGAPPSDPGGLRIGKPLKERDAGDSFDERLEWDRDGQYFHYLTKWMHALCQAVSVAGDAPRWAVELAAAAFAGFVRRSGTGEVVGIYWKISTDLSRPLVPASSPHDALDGFITLGKRSKRLSNGRPMPGEPILARQSSRSRFFVDTAIGQRTIRSASAACSSMPAASAS